MTFGWGCGRRRQLGAPDPKIRRACVKVEIQGLSQRTYADSGKVERILFNILGLEAVNIWQPRKAPDWTYQYVTCLTTTVFCGECMTVDTSPASNTFAMPKLSCLPNPLDTT
jgi:hypothetical protein